MEEENKKSLVQKRISFLVTVFLVLSVLLCLYVAVQVLSNGYVSFGGFMMFRVVTGSMEPTIPTGALMVTQQVDIDSVALGDIICFRTQETEIWGSIVTHRVVEVLELGEKVLLRTQGDANLVADGYLVTRDNFIGRVIWHTGDGSVMASILSFFTNQVGFLGCIVFPCLLLAGLILKDSVSNIRKEMREVMESMEDEDWQDDPLCGMTQEEYDEMYQRIRAELIEELMHCGAIPQKTE